MNYTEGTQYQILNLYGRSKISYNILVLKKSANSPVIRIAIDGNEANVVQRVGSNAYAYELLSAIEKITREKTDVNFTILLSSPAHEHLPIMRPGWRYKVVKPAPLWTQFALSVHLFVNKKKYDVFFTPGHYAPRVSSVPYVSSVMDLAFLYYPKQFRKKDLVQLKEWTRYSVKHSKKVVVISEHTKKDVIEEYGVKKENVVVAYPAIDLDHPIWPPRPKKNRILKKLNVEKPYIVYVGTLQPRKNLIKLIAAFEELLEKGKNSKKQKSRFLDHPQLDELQLVIAGKVGWLADETLARIENSPVKDRIILTGYVTEEQKAVLIQDAECLVLVGLYEGFGIPPLEALMYGCIPVVSASTSLPEVVGDAGVLVNPQSAIDIATGIEKVLTLSAKEKAKMLRMGRQQAKKFTWEASAEKVLNSLLEVAGYKQGGGKMDS